MCCASQHASLVERRLGAGPAPSFEGPSERGKRGSPLFKKKKKVLRTSRQRSPSKCSPCVRSHTHEISPAQSSADSTSCGHAWWEWGWRKSRHSSTLDSSYCLGLFTPFQTVFSGLLMTKCLWRIYQSPKLQQFGKILLIIICCTVVGTMHLSETKALMKLIKRKHKQLY